MDKRELLKRWALAYTEPSLFYVPWNERNDDEYFTITIIPHVDYFDTLTETLVTDTTLRDIAIKGMTYQEQGMYGGLQEVIIESNNYIAKDLNDNIVATSRVLDYMSVAEKIDETYIDDYVMEIYDINTAFYGSYTKRFVIKNIVDTNAINTIRKKISVSIGFVLFILKNGEIYQCRNSSDTEQKVGIYDYGKNKYHFSDKNYYNLYMGYVCGSSTSYRYNSSYIGRYPILRLKKGTYIIEQIMSSGGCDIMLPITIDVTGDMTINYHTTINGIILRSEIEECNEPYFLYSRLPKSSLTDNKTLISLDYGSFGTFKEKQQTYKLSDYSLQIERTLNTAGSTLDTIPSLDGNYDDVYYSNAMYATIRFNSVDSVYRQYICYPKPLSESTILNFAYTNYIGTENRKDRVSYDSNFYLYFDIYQLKPSESYDITELPTISEIETVIMSHSPEEWLTIGYEHINEKFGVQYMHRAQYRSDFTYYQTKDGEVGDFFCDSLYLKGSQGISLVNIVGDYYKKEDVNIAEYKKYDSYIPRYDYIDNKRRNKNYTTYISKELKYADDWDDDKVKIMIEQIQEKMFNEQLK